MLDSYKYRKLPLKERLRLGYAIVTNGCWEWQRSFMEDGYARIRFGGKDYRASRIMWEVTHGEPIPKGLFACHKCDNPKCVNPDHIFLGTAKDNMQDAARKGRTNKPLPEESPNAKLTWEQVRAIREELKSSTTRAVAKKYGMGKSTIQQIGANESWKE